MRLAQGPGSGTTSVKNYVSALFSKLGMHHRTQAAAYAVRAFGGHHHTGDGEPHLRLRGSGD